jgi:riboflavin transporter
MDYVKERALEKINTAAVSQFLILSAVATFLPFYFHLQLVTGPLINAIFIIVLFLVGIRAALVLCLIPSLMALAGGLLPAVLAPAVPFIMISNVLFVLTIEYIYKNSKDAIKGYWLGVVIGAGIKFLFLWASVSLITRIVLRQELLAKIAQMMSWPQFATAVAGGIIAFGILKWLKRI